MVFTKSSGFKIFMNRIVRAMVEYGYTPNEWRAVLWGAMYRPLRKDSRGRRRTNTNWRGAYVIVEDFRRSFQRCLEAGDIQDRASLKDIFAWINAPAKNFRNTPFVQHQMELFLEMLVVAEAGLEEQPEEMNLAA